MKAGWYGWGLDMIMKKDDINKVLWEYYRAIVEHCGIVGTQKIKLFGSTIISMAPLLSFIGLLITQWDRIIHNVSPYRNLIFIGILFIGFILSLFFILFFGYYLLLRIHLNNLFAIGTKIEELQRDILFDKINQEELEERFEKVYPLLNAWKYEIKWKNLFYPQKDSKLGNNAK